MKKNTFPKLPKNDHEKVIVEMSKIEYGEIKKLADARKMGMSEFLLTEGLNPVDTEKYETLIVDLTNELRVTLKALCEYTMKYDFPESGLGQ